MHNYIIKLQSNQDGDNSVMGSSRKPICHRFILGLIGSPDEASWLLAELEQPRPSQALQKYRWILYPTSQV